VRAIRIDPNGAHYYAVAAHGYRHRRARSYEESQDRIVVALSFWEQDEAAALYRASEEFDTYAPRKEGWNHRMYLLDITEALWSDETLRVPTP
jgi:hypothetical protein